MRPSIIIITFLVASILGFLLLSNFISIASYYNASVPSNYTNLFGNVSKATEKISGMYGGFAGASNISTKSDSEKAYSSLSVLTDFPSIFSEVFNSVMESVGAPMHISPLFVTLLIGILGVVIVAALIGFFTYKEV